MIDGKILEDGKDDYKKLSQRKSFFRVADGTRTLCDAALGPGANKNQVSQQQIQSNRRCTTRTASRCGSRTAVPDSARCGYHRLRVACGPATGRRDSVGVSSSGVSILFQGSECS